MKEKEDGDTKIESPSVIEITPSTHNSSSLGGEVSPMEVEEVKEKEGEVREAEVMSIPAPVLPSFHPNQILNPRAPLKMTNVEDNEGGELMVKTKDSAGT